MKRLSSGSQVNNRECIRQWGCPENVIPGHPHENVVLELADDSTCSALHAIF